MSVQHGKCYTHKPKQHCYQAWKKRKKKACYPDAIFELHLLLRAEGRLDAWFGPVRDPPRDPILERAIRDGIFLGCATNRHVVYLHGVQGNFH